MELKQLKLNIAMFLLLIPLFSAYLLFENDEDKQNACLTYMKRTFDSLAGGGYLNDRACYSLPQTFGLILYSESKKATTKILPLIEQRPDNLYKTLIDSFHEDLTISKVLIAKDPSNPVAYRAIFPIGKSVYKYVFDSVMEFSHNGDLWIVATDDDKEEIFIMIAKPDFKRHVLPTKACQLKSLFMRAYPFDTSVFLPSADYASGTCWEAQEESKQIARLYKRLSVLKPKDLVKKIARLEKIVRDSSYNSQIYDSIFKLTCQLDSIWYGRTDSVFKHSERYRKLLKKAAYGALKEGYSCQDLNKWIAKFVSPKLALSVARRYKVIDGCLNNAYHNHIVQIYQLACQAKNYHLFLKALYPSHENNPYVTLYDALAIPGKPINVRIIEHIMNAKSVEFILGSCLAIDTIHGTSICHLRNTAQSIIISKHTSTFLQELTHLLQNDSIDPYNASLITSILLHYKQLSKFFNKNIMIPFDPLSNTPSEIKNFFTETFKD
ncbi:MAG: hypothetical protein GXO48_05960 [Chlorobi bacterium]|nr:hypothetical protein [Chlorobiota bacterium]